MFLRLLRPLVVLWSAFALGTLSSEVAAQQTGSAGKKPEAKALDSKPPVPAAIQKMRKKEDKIEGITWFMDKSTPDTNNRNNVHLYVGQKNSRVWLRWKLQYASDSWLFVKGYIVAADGKRYERRVRFERDNHTTIWEWHDSTPEPADLEMIQTIISAKEVTVRYVGDKYYDDRKISPQEKQALKNVLDAYVALGGKL